MKETDKPTALVTGVTGQDGAHLAELLLRKGYEVYGGLRVGSPAKTWRTDFLGVTSRIKLVNFHLNEPQQIIDLVKKIQPDEIYNLAGESFVANSFDYPLHTMDINAHGVINILEAVRLYSPSSKVFIASSSEVFGYTKKNGGLDEKSARKPCNPYGISKLTADNFARLYREKYGMFVCAGILFNHEGPLRSRHFVTRKITYNMARLRLGSDKYFELGDFNSARDWGSALDYVNAMVMMLQAKISGDFVISTGRLTTVRTVLEIASKTVGFDPKFEGHDDFEVCFDNLSGRILAKVSGSYYRPFDTAPMLGDSSLIRERLGWRNKVSTSTMIESMVEADLLRRKAGITDV